MPDKKAMCALIVKNCQFNNEKYFSIQYGIIVTFYNFAKEKKCRFYDDF